MRPRVTAVPEKTAEEIAKEKMKALEETSSFVDGMMKSIAAQLLANLRCAPPPPAFKYAYFTPIRIVVRRVLIRYEHTEHARNCNNKGGVTQEDMLRRADSGDHVNGTPRPEMDPRHRIEASEEFILGISLQGFTLLSCDDKYKPIGHCSLSFFLSFFLSFPSFFSFSICFSSFVTSMSSHHRRSRCTDRYPIALWRELLWRRPWTGFQQSKVPDAETDKC